jgi:2-oxoglutarate dehydrogenase E1 component
LDNPELSEWIRQKVESSQLEADLTIERKKMILDYLNKSELFEVFLHTKYVGQKRFSLEGGETLIPMLAAFIERGADLGADDFVVGMAHRGRLNVLCNILKKSHSDVFSEFEEGYIPNSYEGSGDVKYHKGFFSDFITEHGKKVQVSLTPNPSHLESVDPVVLGQVRAKQSKLKNGEGRGNAVPILVHGDAALAGQGVIYESMQLCRLPGYSTEGTIHFVINNQIGFTTLPRDGRSTRYCTDIAKSFGSPVFHVNAEDPEGCVLVTLLAAEIRKKFQVDVFIDINCYRKYGHNETDEPAFTQPLEYQLIRKKRPIREIYRDALIHQGVVEKSVAESLEEEFKKALADELKELKSGKEAPKKVADIKGLEKNPDEPLEQQAPTGVPLPTIEEVARKFCTIPDDLKIHPKLAHLIQERLSMVQGEKKVDWGMAEYLAYATLLWQGIPVRLSGQDCGRGTFSHRHAVWMDQAKEETYSPLAHLRKGQGAFEVYNSPLSEYAVLGFEFGYSLSSPEGLTIWEAQFGDFSNGAQIIIDQYIATSEQKWGQKSGLVLLLPHGYEGQGPEHSSARMERFLTLCGNNNMQVANPTTPAQLFHLIRRQMMKQERKPLIIFSPKGLLRHQECVNSIVDFTKGSFQEFLDDPHPSKSTGRLCFCSGRIYYDLIEARAKATNRSRAEDITILRVEQLYPLQIAKLKELLEKYKGFKECIWVQEEPSNMGAWSFMQLSLAGFLPKNVTASYVGRPRSASPAAGSYALHKQQHQAIIEALF